MFTLICSLLTALDVETDPALWTDDQLLVFSDQTGAEMTVGSFVGWGGQEVLGTVRGTVGGEHAILTETTVIVATLEMVDEITLLNRQSHTELR